MLNLTIDGALQPDSQDHQALNGLFSLRTEMLKMAHSSSQQLSLDIIMGYMVSPSLETNLPFDFDEHNVEQMAKRAESLKVKEVVLGKIFSGRFHKYNEAVPALLEIAILMVGLYGMCSVVSQDGTVRDGTLVLAIVPYISPLLAKHLTSTAPRRSDQGTKGDSDEWGSLGALCIGYLVCVARMSGSIRCHTISIVSFLRNDIERWGNYLSVSSLPALLSVACSWRNEEGNMRTAAKSVGKSIRKILELCAILASEQSVMNSSCVFVNGEFKEGKEETLGNKTGRGDSADNSPVSDNRQYKERLSVAIRSTSLLCLMFGMDSVLSVIDKMIKTAQSQSSHSQPSDKDDTSPSQGMLLVTQSALKLYFNEGEETPAAAAVALAATTANPEAESHQGAVEYRPIASPRTGKGSVRQHVDSANSQSSDGSKSMPSGLFFQTLDTIAEEDEDATSGAEVGSKRRKVEGSSAPRKPHSSQSLAVAPQPQSDQKDRSPNGGAEKSGIQAADVNVVISSGLLAIVRNELKIRTILKILMKNDTSGESAPKNVTSSKDECSRKAGANGEKVLGTSNSNNKITPGVTASSDGRRSAGEGCTPLSTQSITGKPQQSVGKPLTQVTRTNAINMKTLGTSSAFQLKGKVDGNSEIGVARLAMDGGPICNGTNGYMIGDLNINSNYNNFNNTNADVPARTNQVPPPPTITMTIPKTPPGSRIMAQEAGKDKDIAKDGESNEAQYSYTYDEYSYEYSSAAIDKVTDVYNSSSMQESKSMVAVEGQLRPGAEFGYGALGLDPPRTIIEEKSSECLGELGSYSSGNEDSDNNGNCRKPPPVLSGGCRDDIERAGNNKEKEKEKEREGMRARETKGEHLTKVKRQKRRTKQRVILPPIERNTRSTFQTE